ncbi:MAG: LysR family transcriptional regulator [Gammaproteobacteria bacterium]|nr:MAG: LysR family transcriptional regulator [Gammaproteobacteria bacterium]
MELSDLVVFTTVAEQGGITRAAKKLHRVPSNVTARIQKLEQELAVALFIRDKNRLRISPSGEKFLEYSRQILALAETAIDQLHADTPTGKLRIGSMEATAASRLAIPLTQFHGNYPDVQLEVQTNPSGTLFDQVIAGEIDLAFVADPIKDPRLSLTPAFKEALILVSHCDHSAIKTSKDLGERPTILAFNPRCAYRARLVDWLTEGQTIANIIEISSYHGLLACITAGMGVGIIPESLLTDYPYSKSLKLHRLPTHIQQSTTYIIWRTDSLKSSMTAFIDCLKE